MNILIATQFPIPHPGGVSTHVEDLIACLNNKGYKVNLLEGTGSGISLFRRLVYAFFCGGRNDNYRMLVTKAVIRLTAESVKNILANNSVDIIHCHDPVAGYAAHLALSETGQKIPIVETIHGPLGYECKMIMGKEIDQSRYLKRIWEIEKQAFLKARHLIAVDTGQARIAIEDFGIDKAKVSVIFNAVSCKTIDSIIKVKTSIKLNKPYLLVPRRLVKKTGVHVAIEALARLGSDIKVNLIIVGGGNLRNQLEQLVERLGIVSRVTFLGSIPRDEVLRLAKDALAVLVPSIPADGVIEATSLAVLEAMACSTVVVASNIGGLAELLNDGVTGFLFPAGDSKTLGNIITQLYKEPDLRDIVCRRARQHVLKNLDTSIWFNKVEQVYKRAIED